MTGSWSTSCGSATVAMSTGTELAFTSKAGIGSGWPADWG
jgi:hypothetical protein